MRTRRARAQLVVVDLQERLLPAIPQGEAALARALFLVACAGTLGVPVVVTEQHPRGIGATVAPMREALPPGAAVVEKIAFGAADEPAFVERVDRLRGEGRDQAVVCGTEAHVCVLQTALGLKERGFEVFVAADAVASRREEDRALALARLREAGCAIVGSEMVAFEWLERAGTDEFRRLLPLIKG